MNPNMRNDKLRGVFEELGFENVRTVISSGNVLFESKSTDPAKLEKQVETALPAKLGFNSTTIIRSRDDLQTIISSDPFKGVTHGPKTNINVTFLKTKAEDKFKLPHTPDGRSYTILAMTDREIYSVIDLTSSKTPDMMTWLEKQFGKEITTRTYKTINRILDKFAKV